MLYKELLDAMLLLPTPPPSRNPILPTHHAFSFGAVFSHLSLDEQAPFTDEFVRQSRAVIIGNGLRFGASEACCLEDMLSVWDSYVLALGLGTPAMKSPNRLSAKSKGKEKEAENTGRSENKLALVYRRAGPAKTAKGAGAGRRARGKKKARDGQESSQADTEEEEEVEEEFAIQMAVEASLRDVDGQAIASEVNPPPLAHGADEEAEREEDELAWAVEMSLGTLNDSIPYETESGEVVLLASQRSATSDPTTTTNHYEPETSSASSPSSPSPSPKRAPGRTSGSIIGRHTFPHSPRLLAVHLESVLAWWLGEREPVGVSLEQTRRCGWCEFEEGCEWR